MTPTDEARLIALAERRAMWAMWVRVAVWRTKGSKAREVIALYDRRIADPKLRNLATKDEAK